MISNFSLSFLIQRKGIRHKFHAHSADMYCHRTSEVTIQLILCQFTITQSQIINLDIEENERWSFLVLLLFSNFIFLPKI